jgi:hypothetical protein
LPPQAKNGFGDLLAWGKFPKVYILGSNPPIGGMIAQFSPKIIFIRDSAR